MSVPLAYLDGRFLAADQAGLPIWDRGVIQGATVTEMIRTFRGFPFQLSAHLQRLRQSLKYLRVEVAETDEKFLGIVASLIDANCPLSGSDLGIVIFVTAGSVPMYAGDCLCNGQPTVCVHTFPLPVQHWSNRYRTGQSLVVSSIRQIPAEILDPRIKYRSRLHWYLADREVQAIDPHAVALLQNQQGNLTETSSGNFFIVSAGRIVTPLSEDVLPGISQAFVEQLAKQRSIPYQTANITLEQALVADEAFTTSTSYCLFPVTRINGCAIGAGTPGPVSQTLLRAWSDAVGVDIATQGTQDHDPL